MALSQQDRDEKSAAKKKAMQAEDLRMTTYPGTRAAIDLLQERHDFAITGEMLSVMLLNLAAMPKELADPIFEVPRHEIRISENVARQIEQANRKEARKPIEK